jgi:hypothetical protein
MDTLTQLAKENFALITLAFSVLSVAIAIITLVYEIRKKKRDKEKKQQ